MPSHENQVLDQAINHNRQSEERDLAGFVLEDFLTREQVASEFKKTVRTIDRWHALRMGPPRTQVGNTILYNRASLYKWLLENERQPVTKRYSK